MTSFSTMAERNTFASAAFDYIRFIAAVAVMLGHGVSRFFGPFPDDPSASSAEILFHLFLSGYGSPAVMVFFVLSGFFIGQSVIRQMFIGQFHFRHYMTRRIVRLWIVLVPALLITYLLDTLGMHFFSTDDIYQADSIFASINPDNLTPGVFISNLFFLQTITTGTLGSNEALWSLSNEFWYYLLFPLIAVTFIGRRGLKVNILSFTFAALILLFVGRDISTLFFVWLMGVGLLFRPSSPSFSRNHKVWLVLSFITFIASLFYVRVSGDITDLNAERYIVGTTFTLFCFALLNSSRQVRADKAHIMRASRLASFSYTLYLIHLPIIVIARAALNDGDGYFIFGLQNVMIFAGVILGTMMMAYGVASLTEHHTHKIYRRLGV